MKIPLVDLKIQYKNNKYAFDSAIRDCINNCQFIGGKANENFALAFAEFCGGGYVSLCGNGTDALYLAIRCLLGQGNGTGEIITVSHTFIATTEAITMAGYKPVFVDIVPDTCLMDVSAIEEKITSNTKGIIPVHLYGQLVAMDKLMAVAQKHHLIVIEDAAQAHGAKYLDKGPGMWGDAATFSFFPGKNLGAWGDGGAVFTRNKTLSKQITATANHGRTEKYIHDIEGTNSRLDGLQASILLEKLKHLPRWNEMRREAAHVYESLISETAGISIIKKAENNEHVYHLFAVEVENRDTVLKNMQQKGIGVGIHYPLPLHMQPAYAHLNISGDSLPVTQKKAERLLSLPIYPELSHEQINYVVDMLKKSIV